MLIWFIFGIMATFVTILYYINRKKRARWMTKEIAVVFVILLPLSLILLLNRFMMPPLTRSLLFDISSLILIFPVEIVYFFLPSTIFQTDITLIVVAEMLYIYLLSYLISQIYRGLRSLMKKH